MLKMIKSTLRIILAGILCFLSVISLLQTQRRGNESLSEIVNGAPIYKENDNIVIHIIAIILLIILFLLMKHLVRKNATISAFLTKNHKLIQVGIAVLVGILSFLIFLGGTRTPVDDQIQVYSAALLFNEDNYINLSKGGYVMMYPQQLGYILYMQLVLKVGGQFGFYILQVINSLFIVGIVYYASCFINDLTDDIITRLLGSSLFLGLLPLELLVTWVYGDIPFYFFMFMFLHYFTLLNKRRIKYSIFAITAAVLCLIFRRHALIFLVAILLVSIVSFLESRNKQILLVGILSFILPMCATAGIQKMYSSKSGYEIEGGIPSIAWITMGTIEGASKPGWFNNYCVPLFYSTDCNRELTQEQALEQLRVQVSGFVENPAYAIGFYKRKICTQWNAPYFNTEQLIGVDDAVSIKGLSKFIANREDRILVFLSILQSLVYLGTLIYILIKSYRGKFADTLPEMFILGGFLFSIIWEANSRYVFSYFLVMIPLAVVGWNRAVMLMKEKIFMIDKIL